MLVPIVIFYAASLGLEKLHRAKNLYVIKEITIFFKGSKAFVRIKFRYFLECLTADQLEKFSRAVFEYILTAFIHWLIWKISSFFIALTLEKLGFFNFMGRKFIKLFTLFNVEIDVFCSIFAQEMESILANRALNNPLSREQWEEFFRSILTESEEGIEIFRSLVIEIINHAIDAQPIQTMRMVSALDTSGEFVLLPRQNKYVKNLIRSMEKSTILWQFSRYCKGYDFNKLMKMLKSHYSGHMPYQFTMVKRYLEFLQKSLVIVIIPRSEK
jgi:hypothetical protein